MKDGKTERIRTLCLNDFDDLVEETERKAKNHRETFEKAKAIDPDRE